MHCAFHWIDTRSGHAPRVFNARYLLLVLVLCAGGYWCSGVVQANGAQAAGVPGFDGTWVLARISDGRRSREDLDESLTISTGATHIHLDYAIADRYGKRQLLLEAPLDGSPAMQSVQGRPCTVIVTLQGRTLTLEMQRQASFGRVHNRRVMRLSSDGGSIESERFNLEPDGGVGSSWRETWIRQPVASVVDNEAGR